jgi:hypothetical protein
MRKLLTFLFVLISVFSMAQYTPNASKIQYANGISLGTKGGFNYPDSNIVYWRFDSTLMAKYKGAGFIVGKAGTSPIFPTDTASMLSNYRRKTTMIETTDILNGAVTFSKFQNIAGQTILGNNSGGSSTVNNLGLLNGLIFNGTNVGLGNITPTSVASSGAISGSSLTAVQSSSGKSVTFAPTGVTLTADRTLKPQNKSYTIADSADVGVQYWKRSSINLSPITAGDQLYIVDGTNSFATLIGTSYVQSGAVAGDYVYMNGAHGFYQSAPNKQLDLKIRNLTSANRTVYFPNADITVADSATVAGKLSLSGGTLTGILNGTGVSLSGAFTGTTSAITGSAYIGGASYLPNQSMGGPATTGTSQNGSFRIRVADNAVMDFGAYSGGTGYWIQTTNQTALGNYYDLWLNPAGADVRVGSLGTGTVYSNSGKLTNTNPSDSTLKNTITTYTYGLNEILQLKPKTFYYNSDKKKESLKYGFIAQDVQKIMPDVVRVLNPKDSVHLQKLGLETDGIYVALINAIKEQQAIIEDLKIRVAKLENK